MFCANYYLRLLLKPFFLLLLYSVSTHTKIVSISNESEFNELVQGKDKQVIVAFSANWCGACVEVKKPFEEVSLELEFDTVVAFAQIDIDKVPLLSKKHDIEGIPTFIYLKNGKQKDKEVGLQDIRIFKNHLRSKLRKIFTLDKEKKNPRMALVSKSHT